MNRLLPLTLFLLSPALHAFDTIELTKTFQAPPDFKVFLPRSLAVASDRTLWVLDHGSGRLLSFSSEGALLDKIGGPGSGPGQFINPQGLAIGPDQRVYVSDTGNNRVDVFGSDGKFLLSFGEKGSGLGQLKDPGVIAVSQDGVVFVADRGNSRLQFFSSDGVFLQALSIGSDVQGLGVDASGRIYSVNAGLKQVEQWSTAGQLLKSFTGSEVGVKAFAKPERLAVSPEGLIYVTDRGTAQFRELTGSGHTLGSFGRPGNGPGQFNGLDGIALSGSSLYISDAKNHRIQIFSLTRKTAAPPITPAPALRLEVGKGKIWAADVDRLASSPDGRVRAYSNLRGELISVERDGSLSAPLELKKKLGLKIVSGLATDNSGNLYFADSANSRVLKTDGEGAVLLEVGKSGKFFKNGLGDLSKPQGVAFGQGGTIVVADTGNSRFQSFNDQGLFLFAGGEKGVGQGQLKNPSGIALDTDRIYIADNGNAKIVAFHTNGSYLREMGVLGPEKLSDARDIAVDREGNIFALDAVRGRVLVYDAQGIYLGGFGSLGKATGFFDSPRALAVSDNGQVYVAEAHRIQSFHVVTRPPSPLQVKATPGEGYIDLSWEAVKTRFPAKYSVYRSSGTLEPFLLKEVVDTSFSDATATPEVLYTYTVVAQSVQGAKSVPSIPVRAAAKPTNTGPRLNIVAVKIDDVFSAHYKYYARVPLGEAILRNTGKAPVERAKVTFAIQGFMDYPTETVIEELRPDEEKRVPLLATFNNRILSITETTPMQAQVRVTFVQNDKDVVSERNLPFKLYSRNSIRWNQKEQFSAFVTPNDPTVIEFSRSLVLPFIKDHRDAPMPGPVVNAWALFEGLGAYGIGYAPRPNNPYDRVSLDSTTVDSMQFARETLQRKSGDCSDVVALLASSLESLTVTTAALDAPGHLFLMFDTGEMDHNALGLPESMLVHYAGSWWIPVEATMLGSPFMDAWKKGAEEYAQWAKSNQVTPIDIHDAWRTFEPATLPETASGPIAPSKDALEDRFVKNWQPLVDLRWHTMAAHLGDDPASDPGKTHLAKGLLAMDFHRREKAQEEFMEASKVTSTAASAFNNLGNLALLDGDYKVAESQYAKAAHFDTQDAGVQLNLARVYLKLNQKPKAEEAFKQALVLDPALKAYYVDVTALAL